jgi:hypothetical protein
MRTLFLALLLLPAVALAQPKPAARPATPAANAPKPLGKFDDWQAAIFNEGGQAVCYAFTRARTSTPALPGRGEVLLTVTHRLAAHDAVSISAGFAYATGAAVTVQADTAALEFYTAQRSAFARDGKASVAAFQKASAAVAKSPGPKAATISDSFSLKGFSAAYTTIGKACPAK